MAKPTTSGASGWRSRDPWRRTDWPREQPPHPGPRWQIVNGQVVVLRRDVAVERVVSLQPEVGQSLHVLLVRARPINVVDYRIKVGLTKSGWNVVKDRTQKRVAGVS